MHEARSSQPAQRQRAASEPVRAARTLAQTELVDGRPEAAAQQDLQEATNHSPYVTAQRRQLADAFGTALQRKPDHSVSQNQPVAQLLSLNGVLVDTATPYPNANQAAVLTHMHGEWDGVNAHAVSGGHLLTEMVNDWGAAVPNADLGGLDANSAAGVHFAGALPGDKITPHQHDFKLVTGVAGQRRRSNTKTSTFWPSSWGDNELTATLTDSHQNGAANMWASKANTSYWYRWQTLGANTLFPVEKVATATGTNRNKAKAGRLPRV